MDDIKNYLSYDENSGDFTWLKRPKHSHIKIGEIAGCLTQHGYIQIRFNGKTYLAHRLAWFFVHNYMPIDEIDHLNHNRSDNRIYNLRPVNRQDNSKNQSLYFTNTSGTLGVHWHKRYKKWQAIIKINGKVKYLGRFNNLEDAVSARKAANIEYGFHENHGAK